MPNEINTTDLPSTALHCQAHGAFTSHGSLLTIGRLRREIWTACPQCRDSHTTHTHLANAERAATAEQERLAQLLQQAAIPKRFLACSFDNFVDDTGEQEQVLARCERYAANFAQHLAQGTGLVLAGKVGTGKSHLACAILQALMPTHVGAYTTMMDLVHLLREGWGVRGLRSEASILAELARLPLLVIDEIGVQYSTAAEQVHLFEVLDRRYRDMMPTLLITNQDKDGFKGFVGERIADRLADTASWVQCNWPSHRGSARVALKSGA